MSLYQSEQMSPGSSQLEMKVYFLLAVDIHPGTAVCSAPWCFPHLETQAAGPQSWNLAVGDARGRRKHGGASFGP